MTAPFFTDPCTIALGFSASQDHARSVCAVTSGQISGVRWSGMSDDRSWTPSPEAQARAQAAYLTALALQEAEVAVYAERMGLVKKDAA